ncbi:hypothetical protein [Halomonas sp. M20]|uniref:hypothetical protein n=1 Tax=Halomonas sp. M20 TaxID=2763264 RepID=UPI001D0B5B01|nr:hypothetical protein [Halomonas sp. M20]
MSFYEREAAGLNDMVHRLQNELARARRERDELAMYLASAKRQLIEAEDQLVTTHCKSKKSSLHSSKAKRILIKAKRKLAMMMVA